MTMPPQSERLVILIVLRILRETNQSFGPAATKALPVALDIFKTFQKVQFRTHKTFQKVQFRIQKTFQKVQFRIQKPSKKCSLMFVIKRLLLFLHQI